MTDLLLVAWVSLLIELTRLQWMLGRGKKWTPGARIDAKRSAPSL